MADNIRELKRLQKEKDFQEKQKQISDITNFQHIKKKHKIEKTELELLNQILSSKAAWELDIRIIDIPINLGGGEEYWM